MPGRRPGGPSLALAATLALVLLLISPVHGDFAYISTTASGTETKHPCMPQHNEQNTTATFHKVDAEAVVVNFTDTCKPENGDGDIAARELLTFFNPSDVSGKIAVVPGSACLWGTYDGGDENPWFYYLNDFQRRVDSLVAAGAIGVIWGEGRFGKIPEQMVGHKSNSSQAVPVCTMDKDVFNAFKETFKETGLSSIDTTNALMYRLEDEQYPPPELTYTYITLEEPWVADGPDGFDFPMPAKMATFGPKSAAAVKAELVHARFIPECDSNQYEQCALHCWTKNATQIFTESLTDKVTFFTSKEELHYGCYPFFTNWAQLAQEAGAKAVVYGTYASVDGWRRAGPYITPFDLQIPFLSLFKVHTETLEHVNAESEAHTGLEVTIKTPIITNGAGVAYFAPADPDFGPAPILVWRDEQDHFYCDAGQATFNPAPWAGLALPTNENDVNDLNTNRVVLLHASDACVAANVGNGTCGACLAPGPSGQIAQMWANIDGQEVTVNAAATVDGEPVVYAADAPSAARAAFGTNFIAMMFLEDFDCFASYDEFSMVADAMGASALLLAMPESPFMAPHLYGVADVDGDGTRRTTPTFSVTYVCAMRALHGGNNVFADLPAIDADGDASIGPHAYAAGYTVPNTQAMQDTSFVLEHAPDTVCGDGEECLAGQANFNPSSYPAVKAEVIFVEAVATCQSTRTCLECDRLEVGELSTQSYLRYVGWDGEPVAKVDIAGRVVFAMEDTLRCAHPFTNFVKDVELHQALGVIIGLTSSSIETLTASAVPFQPQIPTFSIANGNAQEFEQTLKQGLEISVILPRIYDGRAVAGSIATASVSQGTLRLGVNHGGNYGTNGTSKKKIGAGEIVGFFVLIGLVFGIGAACVYGRKLHKRGVRLIPAWVSDATRGMRSFGASPNAPSAERGTAAGAGAATRRAPTAANPYEQFNDEPDGAGDDRYAAHRERTSHELSELPAPALVAPSPMSPIPPAPRDAVVDAFAQPVMPPHVPPQVAPAVNAGDVELVSRNKVVTNPFEAPAPATSPFPPQTIPPADPYIPK